MPGYDVFVIMKHFLATTFGITASAAVLLVGCDNRKPTVVERPIAATSNFETTILGTAIDAYIASPTPAMASAVDQAFSEIDGEIAELDQQVATGTGADRSEASTKADNLRAYRNKESLRYTEAQLRAKAASVKTDAMELGDRVEESARKAGENVKEGVGDAVDAVRKNLP